MAKQLGYMDSTDMPNIASAIRSKNSAAPDNMKISEMPTYILAIDTKPEASTPVNETIVPGGSATIPAGYYENAGSVSASLATTAAQIDSSIKTDGETRTIVPNASTTISGGKYYTSDVVVNASLATTTDQIDSSIKETKSATGSLTSDTTVAATTGKVMTSVTVSKPDMSSATATAADVISGKTAYGSDGALITGTLESLDCYSDTATPSADFGNEGEIWIQVSKVYKKTTSGWTEMSADAFGTMADGKKFNKLAAPVSAIGDVTASTNAINITDDTLASGEYTLYYEDASGNKLTNWGEIGTITKS